MLKFGNSSYNAHTTLQGSRNPSQQNNARVFATALSKPSQKTEARREKFRKIGRAISKQTQYISDPVAGLTQANPWRVLKGASGFFGMQIDTRPGLTRKSDNNTDENN